MKNFYPSIFRRRSSEAISAPDETEMFEIAVA